MATTYKVKRKVFSLRERNRVRSKADAAKDQLEERNIGEKPETTHNTFHNSRHTTHLEHTRPRLTRNFSKKEEGDTRPEDVTIRIGHFANKKKLGELTDKQLKNIAAWNNKTDEQKKNVKKNSAIVIGSQAGVGALLGNSIAKNNKLKGTGIGAAVGAAVGAGFTAAGSKLHKKHAKAAEKVLENRSKKNKDKK